MAADEADIDDSIMQNDYLPCFFHDDCWLTIVAENITDKNMALKSNV